MKKLIEDLEYVDFYWDNILVYIRFWEEFIKVFCDLVLCLLRVGMIIRLIKCIFGVSCVDFLVYCLE